MKNVILFAAIILSVTASYAQTPQRTEGSHQSEFNAMQLDVDGETKPSKTLHDARYVSDQNEDNQLTADSAATAEENTMGKVSNEKALDGTGNVAEASLNVAGSPIPGSPRKAVAEKKSKPQQKVNSAPVRQATTKSENTSESKSKKKKRK